MHLLQTETFRSLKASALKSNSSTPNFIREMTKTMTTHLICTIAALLSLHLTNFGSASSDEMIIDPVIEPPVILPEPLPLLPIDPIAEPPVILPEPLPVLPIGPIVAPPLTQPEPLPLIPGPGGTWSPSAQPKLEDSSDAVPDHPSPLRQAPPGRLINSTQILALSS